MLRIASDQVNLNRGDTLYAQFRGGIGYAHARAAGAHVMIAGVSGENAEGRAFHLALGYREIATLCEVGYKFGRWMDIVLMQKFLS